MKKDRMWLVLLLVLLAVFVLGVGRLFQLRFEAGDVYPPYSSLRADPLGTKALFESLEIDRKSTRLNSSHSQISYAVFCLKKKKKNRPAQIHAQGVHENT